jgi:outer membrane biosynthesis protein TonB
LRQRSPGAFISALAAAIQTGPTDPHPIAKGLDPNAHERLSRGTGELELSFERSSPPPHQTGTIRSYGALDLHRRLRKPQQLAAALAALLFSAGVLWFMTRPEDPPPRAAAPQPAPVAAAEPPAAPLASEPEPAPEPAPEKPAKVSAKRSPRTDSVAPHEPKEKAVSAASLVTKAQDELVQGHMSAALSLYEQATRADAQNAAAFRGLGLVNERLGHKGAALRAMRRAIALTPNDPKNALLREHIERLEAAP